MKILDLIKTIIIVVAIFLGVYLLYKFLRDPIEVLSKKVPSLYENKKTDRLLFGFINLDEGFAGSKRFLNSISGGRLFPIAKVDDVGIRLPLAGETNFTFGTNPIPVNKEIN